MLAIIGFIAIFYFGFKLLGKGAGYALAVFIIYFVAKWLFMAALGIGIFVGVGLLIYKIKDKINEPKYEKPTEVFYPDNKEQIDSNETLIYGDYTESLKEQKNNPHQ